MTGRIGLALATRVDLCDLVWLLVGTGELPDLAEPLG